jgi:hypothetical protein
MVTGMAGRMTQAVAAALRTIQGRPEDAAAIALCRHYARLIDDAAPAARHRKALATLARAVALYDEDGKAGEALQVVAGALAEHTTTSDLGPKLLTALQALGLTLAGRGAGKGASGDGNPATPRTQNPIDELRERRAAR